MESENIQQVCQLDDVTSTFVQEIVQACEQVEISRSLSKAVHHEFENDNTNVDFAAKIDTVITAVPFLQHGSIENTNQQSDPHEKDETTKTPGFPIKHTYQQQQREKVVSESLSTLVLMTQSDNEFYKVIFESLFLGIYVHISVLESCMQVLNVDEKHHGTGFPLRLFLTPNILPLPMLKKGITNKARMEVFQSSIDVVLTNYNIKNINKVDLICIPIIKSDHVFLLVFDLKNPPVVIIDNMETANPSVDGYSHIPYIMKDVLANYLLAKDHPTALKISHQTPQSMDLPRKTSQNGMDCGVFCMRHMETYMGGGPKKWNCGLMNESKGQNKQLNQLRFKYLCKILMSNVNFL
ncbi:hypothetical protein R6Q57_020658 [Mikania cordata]